MTDPTGKWLPPVTRMAERGPIHLPSLRLQPIRIKEKKVSDSFTEELSLRQQATLNYIAFLIPTLFLVRPRL